MGKVGFTAVEYVQIRLPFKPCLTRWAIVVDLGDDRLQFRGAEFSYTLRYKLFIEIFHSVRLLLDGNHSVEEISLAGGEKYLPTTIIFLLKMLRAHGVLQEGNVLPPYPLSKAELDQYAGQLSFLSHFVSDAPSLLASLRKAKVAVLGEGKLQKYILNSIASLGIDQITSIDSRLQDDSCVEFSSLDLENQVQGMDFLIACQESPGFSFFEHVNKACLKTGIRWMRVAFEGTTAMMGPTIIPFQSACYMCYDKRIQSNMQDLESYEAYRNQVIKEGTTLREGWLDPLSSIVAGQVALEMGRVFSGFAPPKTFGRFFEFSASSPVVAGHDVLRLPRCMTCNVRGPKQGAWDTSPQNQ